MARKQRKGPTRYFLRIEASCLQPGERSHDVRAGSIAGATSNGVTGSGCDDSFPGVSAHSNLCSHRFLLSRGSAAHNLIVRPEGRRGPSKKAIFDRTVPRAWVQGSAKGKKVKAGILTAYFVKRDEARRALRKLGRRGFRRAALIHRGADARVHILDPFLWRRALVVTLSAILPGGLTGAGRAGFPRVMAGAERRSFPRGPDSPGLDPRGRCPWSARRPGRDAEVEERSRAWAPRGSLALACSKRDRPDSPGSHRSHADSGGRPSRQRRGTSRGLCPEPSARWPDRRHGESRRPAFPAQMQEHACRLALESRSPHGRLGTHGCSTG